MTNPPVFEITYSDFRDGRIPSNVILPRHTWLKQKEETDEGEDTVIAPKSDEAHRRYWKLVIGTYMMHYGKLIYNVDPAMLYRLRKFPKGYELYSRQRLGDTRTADQYLFGFDRHGNREIVFDSPYAFVLHGISLVFGSTRHCPCKVCDDTMKQKDIRHVLREAAPQVKIPSIVQFKKRLAPTTRSSAGEPSQTAPVQQDQYVRNEAEPRNSIKDEPEETIVKIEVSFSQELLAQVSRQLTRHLGHGNG